MGILKKLTSFPKAPKGAITRALSTEGIASQKLTHGRDESQELGGLCILTPSPDMSNVYVNLNIAFLFEATD